MTDGELNRARVASLANEIDADFGQRIDFLIEIDKLKTIIRRSQITDGSRLENTAEHSWHLAMVALVMVCLRQTLPDTKTSRSERNRRPTGSSPSLL